jgi:N-acetyltransferase
VRIEPFSLRGDHVELIPLSPEHAGELAEAAAMDRSTYAYTEVPDGEAGTARYVAKLLAQRDADAAVPFAQRRVADGRLVGCTRYMELRWWWEGSAAPAEVEVGGTWLSGSAQRGPVNTEAKLLLLSHAFERWEVGRVALCTDVRNARSRTAIERIGARFEGILRQHRPSAVEGEAGRLRDSALYALTADEWPGARDALRGRLSPNWNERHAGPADR